MSNNGKTGHGRGNNRRRPFRRRGNEGDTQKKDSPEWPDGRQPGGRRAEGVSAPEGRPHGRDMVSESQGGQKRHGNPRRNTETTRERYPFFERPKWIPPKLSTEPLPVSDCAWCGKPIRDLSAAIADKDSGLPVHFDCVISRITLGEKLEKEDTVTYIGGGRFGIVAFSTARHNTKDSQDKTANRDFTIKKVIEWENKDQRAGWRSVICDHYSVT